MTMGADMRCIKVGTGLQFSCRALQRIIMLHNSLSKLSRRMLQHTLR